MVKLDDSKKIEKYNNTYKNNKGVYLYKLYADWCGHCLSMENDWKHFIKNNKTLLKDINVVEIESKHLKSIRNKNIQVPSFPSILLFNDNKLIDTFSSQTERTEIEFVKFLEKNTSQVGGSMIMNELQQLLIPATLLATRHLIKNKSLTSLNIFKNKSFKNKFTTNIGNSISRTINDGETNLKSIANKTKKSIKSFVNKGKKSIKNIRKHATSGINNIRKQAKSGIKKAFHLK